MPPHASHFAHTHATHTHATHTHATHTHATHTHEPAPLLTLTDSAELALFLPSRPILSSAQLWVEKRELKAKLRQAEAMKREEERQRQEQSFKEYKAAKHYRRTAPRPNLGIDPWRHRIKLTLSEQKAEEEAMVGAVRKVSQSPPHQYLSLPQGLSFFGRSSREQAIQKPVIV